VTESKHAREVAIAKGYSYRSASAGKILAADQEGYTVATSEMATATNATRHPSIVLGANGT